MPTRIFAQDEPLTDAEVDRLGEFLKGSKAMNLEELDGFFAALIAGPDLVMPSEYLPEVFGGEMSESCEFGGLDEANEILGLMMRHWIRLPVWLKVEALCCLISDRRLDLAGEFRWQFVHAVSRASVLGALL